MHVPAGLAMWNSRVCSRIINTKLNYMVVIIWVSRNSSCEINYRREMSLMYISNACMLNRFVYNKVSFDIKTNREE